MSWLSTITRSGAARVIRHGLAGDEIPLEARICGLCDVFDALTSDRPYKKAWSIKDATAHISDQSGRHFDPELVDRFMQVLPDMEEIKRRYAEAPESG